jgi:DNA polymerase-3 subunit delta'
MLFGDILGQDETKLELIKQGRSDKIHHAHLFVGQMGYGTFALSLAFVQYIMCSQKKEDDSCGECSNCEKIQKLTHPDIHFAFPSFKDKEYCDALLPKFREIVLSTKAYFDKKDWLDFNGEKNYKIRSKDCDDIINKLQYASFEGGYKIQFVWMAEELDKESNKLLKILEEPTAKTIFILIAESAESLLPTIISRCLLHKIPKLDIKYMNQRFQDELNAYQHTERTIVYAEGDLIACHRLLNDDTNDFSLELHMLDFLRGLLNFNTRKYQNIQKLLDTCEKIAKTGREQQKQFLDFFSYFLRETIQYKYTEQCNISDNLGKAVVHYANLMELDQLEYWMQQINKTYWAIEGNVNSKISFVSLALISGKIQVRKEFLKINNIEEVIN